MKRKLVFLGLFIVIVIGAVLVLNFIINKTETEQYNDVRIKYNYLQKEIDQRLSEQDSKIVKKILNNRHLYSDNPSCGFSKDISIQFNKGNVIYGIAQDNCPIFKDMKTGKFFRISQTDRDNLNNILEKYGAVFPCI